MANLALLDNIDWSIRTRPTPNLVDDWTQVILPGRDFTIIYKIPIPDPETGDDAYQLVDMQVPYAAEGQPVTIADLLTSIYEFYQEPLDKKDPFYEPPQFTKRGDSMGDEHQFVGLEEVAPNTYNLELDLTDTGNMS